jgi:hypothetical protein
VEDLPLSSDRDENNAFVMQAECLENISLYHSRVKKTVFVVIFARPSFIHNKTIVVSVYTHRTGYILPH